MSNIMVGSYNNYYNRIVKVHDYSEILTAGHNWMTFTKINFNPNDGVNTTLILNFNPLAAGYNHFEPDYLVVLTEDNTISQRWFVIDIQRTRQGQINLTLKRDLLADYREQVLNGITFLKKGYVSADNPLIFNSEKCNFNQIKRAEMPLRDDTRCAWIIGYVAPNLADSEDKPTDSFSVEVEYDQEVVPDISTFEYSEYVGRTLKGLMNQERTNFMFWAQSHRGYNADDLIAYYLNNTSHITNTGQFLPFNTLEVLNLDGIQMTQINLNLSPDIFDPVLSDWLNADDYYDLYKLKDRIYNDNGTYKKVVITPKEDERSVELTLNANEHPGPFNTIISKLIENGAELNNPEGSVLLLTAYFSSFTLTLETVDAPFTTSNVTFKSINRRLYDAPYKMFCMPVSEAVCRYGEIEFSMEKERQLQIAASIATGLGPNLYDIQLLPYCPISDQFGLLTDVNGNEYLGGTEDIDYSLVKDAANRVIGILFWCPRASFTTNIQTRFLVYPDLNYNNPIEFKVGNETNSIRLVSPNYANYENINYFMNYGIDYINVDCTYKPITPYIKLNINYKGLYGSDFNDSRGLILGGDFSLPVMSDAWVNYQIQNKNYSNIFERETRHLEVQNAWNMAETSVGAVSGTISGAAMGSLMGPAGAVAGGVASAVGGILDVAKVASLQQENMRYRRDIFNMQLQNIQALPQGLVKTSAFNYNSKLWPFMEFYKATEVEEEALRNKLRYTGMTLEVIGNIKDYLNPAESTYIQGEAIRIDDIFEDTHILSEINRELNMGVYL